MSCILNASLVWRERAAQPSSRDHVTSPFKFTAAHPMSTWHRGDIDKFVKDTVTVAPGATFHDTELCVT